MQGMQALQPISAFELIWSLITTLDTCPTPAVLYVLRVMQIMLSLQPVWAFKLTTVLTNLGRKWMHGSSGKVTLSSAKLSRQY